MGQQRNHPASGNRVHLNVHTPSGDARMDADQNIVIGNTEDPRPDGKQEAGKPMDWTRQEAAATRRKTG